MASSNGCAKRGACIAQLCDPFCTLYTTRRNGPKKIALGRPEMESDCCCGWADAGGRISRWAARLEGIQKERDLRQLGQCIIESESKSKVKLKLKV